MQGDPGSWARKQGCSEWGQESETGAGQATDYQGLAGPLDPSGPGGILEKGLLPGEDGERLAKPDAWSNR